MRFFVTIKIDISNWVLESNKTVQVPDYGNTSKIYKLMSYKLATKQLIIMIELNILHLSIFEFMKVFLRNF